MADTRYCLCCGEDVPYNIVERHERRELTCSYCGFVLDVEKLWDATKFIEGHVLVADDSKYVRNLIVDVLKASKQYSRILSFENGLELTTTFSRLISDRSAVDIAIIDLNMPIMDGLTAARTIRAIETKNNLPHIPLIFFSSEKANDALKAQMELLKPAGYMNKGSDPDPESLSRRVEQLVGYLAEKYKKLQGK